MRKLKNKKGFTLLEILIVLVVLGTVAGLMFPVLTANIEKSRAQEAIHALGTIREAMTIYYQTNSTNPNSYNGASIQTGATGFIGFDPSVSAANQSAPLFTYFLSIGSDLQGFGGGYTVTATRIGSSSSNNIQIDNKGTVKRNGIYN